MQTKIYLCYSDPDTACGGRAFRPFKQERHGGISDVGKPPLSPPGVVFPIVWSILYILMGISSAIIWCSESQEKPQALKLYAAQLAVNFFWSIFFFAFGWRLFAFFWLLLLLVLTAKMVKSFYQIDKKAAYLQIPYLLWLLFAAYLNFGVWMLNR